MKPSPKSERYRNIPLREYVLMRPCMVRGRSGHECHGRRQAVDVVGWDGQPQEQERVVTLCQRAADERSRLGTLNFNCKYGVSLHEAADAIAELHRMHRTRPVGVRF